MAREDGDRPSKESKGKGTFIILAAGARRGSVGAMLRTARSSRPARGNEALKLRMLHFLPYADGWLYRDNVRGLWMNARVISPFKYMSAGRN